MLTGRNSKVAYFQFSTASFKNKPWFMCLWLVCVTKDVRLVEWASLQGDKVTWHYAGEKQGAHKDGLVTWCLCEEVGKSF